MGNFYNGYSWDQRMAKYKEMLRLIAAGELDKPEGPCQLCLDPGGIGTGVTFEYHDEDYSREYRWSQPEAYVVCRTCHIYRIHQRFTYPHSWIVFLAHVARGGYARDMRDREVKRELERYRKALDVGAPLPELQPRNAGARDISGSWFSQLTLEPADMERLEFRPRP